MLTHWFRANSNSLSVSDIYSKSNALGKGFQKVSKPGFQSHFEPVFLRALSIFVTLSIACTASRTWDASRL